MTPEIPEIRTSRAAAIVLCVTSVFALAIALTLGDSIDTSVGSEGAALGILAAWCLSGVVAGVAAIVDAYIRPEGELLGVVVSVAATVFAILAMIVVVALVFTVGDLFTSSVSS